MMNLRDQELLDEYRKGFRLGFLVGAAIVALVFVFVRCGGTDPGTLDAGTLDAGTLDAGTLDAGTLDAGTLDGTPCGTLGEWCCAVPNECAAPLTCDATKHCS